MILKLLLEKLLRLLVVKQKIQCGGHMSLIAETKLFFSPIKRHIALCLYYFYFKICYNQKKYFSVYFWLHGVFIVTHRLSLVVVCKLLIMVASLVEQKL